MKEGRNLGRFPRNQPGLALCVDDQEPPYSYVMIECTTHFEDDAEKLREWATRIGGRYVGEDLAPQYGRRNFVPGEHLVCATVDRVVAVHGIAD